MYKSFFWTMHDPVFAYSNFLPLCLLNIEIGSRLAGIHFLSTLYCPALREVINGV